MWKKLVVFLAIVLGASVAWAGALQIITENAPPLNYTEDGTESGRLTGLSAEVVFEVQKRLSDQTPIKVLPWARGYAMAQSDPDVMLFSTTRTAPREKLFKWVGPIATNVWMFFARKGSGIKISSLDDARKVKLIGAYQDDVREQFLKEKGFTNLDVVPNPQTILKKLMAGRNDLWISDTMEAPITAKTSGVDPKELEPVFEIQRTELYCAFSLGTPDDVVAKWRKALDEVKADGTFQKITDKWTK